MLVLVAKTGEFCPLVSKFCPHLGRPVGPRRPWLVKPSSGTWGSSTALLCCTAWLDCTKEIRQKPQPWLQPHVTSLPLAAWGLKGQSTAAGTSPQAAALVHQISRVPNGALLLGYLNCRRMRAVSRRP